MTIPNVPKAVWAAVTVLLVFVGGYGVGCQAADSRWTRRLNVVATKADSSIRKLQDSILLVSERERVDTVRLTQWKDRWKVLAQDTQWVKGDSVPYPVYVNVVKVADSTIQACGLVVLDCQHRSALLEEANKQLVTQRDAYRIQAAKSPPKRWPWFVAGAVGALVAQKLLKP